MALATQSLHYKEAHLHLGEINLSDYVRDYRGPSYIYNTQILKDRFTYMKDSLPQCQIYYAVKANSNSEILRSLRRLGAGVDVVSWGEVLRALQTGFEPDQVIFSGVGKTRNEIEAAIKTGIHQLNVESIPELKRVAEVARYHNLKVPVALRLNPDVDIQTHPYIATGLRDNKFGIELAVLPEVVQILKKEPQLKLQGLSLHLGSQMQELSAFGEALQKLKNIYLDLKRQFDSLQCFDFGGGLGIFYESFDWQKDLENLRQYGQIVKQHLGGLNSQLQTEPGRWLVARAGILLCQVQYVKQTQYKTFVILDSGMNHLLRPSLYNSFHRIWSLKESSEKAVYDVVGPICESGDFFAKERSMAKVEEGDFIVVADTGAYGYSMANQYNLQPLPREIVK